MVDLLIIGAGMAGLSAAARAVQAGASVVVVERAGEIGGSARYAGYVWTAPSVDVLAEVDPGGDPLLRRTLVEGFAPALAWLQSLGTSLGREVAVLRFGRGHSTDVAGHLDRCRRLVLGSADSELLVDADVQDLLVENGRVQGAVVQVGDDRRSIEARWTLLATGGYQGDAQAVALRIHPNARDVPLRSNPTSVGGGLRLARQAGAAFGRPDAGFYGHLVAAEIPLDDPAQFANLTLYYSEHTLLFNQKGERFIDETLGDHLSAMAAVEQPGARVLAVADQRVRDEWELVPYVEGIPPLDRFALYQRRGGRCAVAHSLDEFSYLPDDWGYPGEVVRDGIGRFNQATAAGAELRPGRRYDPLPLDRPPYYVVEAVPAITFTFGGVLIDGDARALTEDGMPIPGLLAAGADAGGLYVRAYAGGLAAALVFGLRAAQTALEETSTR
jgi:succinate dehydrogenase/fumarate reductase flavoprotein subunit